MYYTFTCIQINVKQVLKIPSLRYNINQKALKVHLSYLPADKDITLEVFSTRELLRGGCYLLSENKYPTKQDVLS